MNSGALHRICHRETAQSGQQQEPCQHGCDPEEVQGWIRRPGSAEHPAEAAPGAQGWIEEPCNLFISTKKTMFDVSSWCSSSLCLTRM